MKYEMKLDYRDSIVVLYRSCTKFEVNLGTYIEIIKYLVQVQSGIKISCYS